MTDTKRPPVMDATDPDPLAGELPDDSGPRLRVINLGLPKSGTTTLAKALREAGLTVADWRLAGSKTAFVGGLMAKGYRETGDPLALLSDYDALTQMDALQPRLNVWPQLNFPMMDAIRAHHPGVKFLLSYRDPVKQADSMRRWNDFGTVRLPRAAIRGLRRGKGSTPEELARWIEWHYAECRAHFAGPDFLEYDLDDPMAPRKIGDFLGRYLPWWGVVNANPPGSPRSTRAQRKPQISPGPAA